MSVYIGAITGFVFLVSICFCIGNIQETATTPTGVPLIQIFFDSTGSKVGTCVLSSLIVIIGMFCAMALQVSLPL
jgi:choline transport protein